MEGPEGGGPLPTASRKIDPERLRKLREEARITQTELARLSRVHHVSICNYERGNWEQSQRLTVLRLADGLSKALSREVDPEEFLVPLQAEPAEPIGIAS
jgi:transcriptional regulator with XRE-family HTH domain